VLSSNALRVNRLYQKPALDDLKLDDLKLDDLKLADLKLADLKLFMVNCLLEAVVANLVLVIALW
jgi:hypothetical protein